jgi:hypothetical protein
VESEGQLRLQISRRARSINMLNVKCMSIERKDQQIVILWAVGF